MSKRKKKKKNKVLIGFQDNKEKDSNILKVEVKNYGECAWCRENKVILNVPWNIWSIWLYLSSKMGNKEWSGVYDIENNTIVNFRLPEQEVSSGEVEMKEDLGGKGIVHSHHNMGAFHSSQDEKYCRNLYDYSIVLSNNNGYDATKKIKLPCGAFGYVKVELNIIGIPNIDTSKIKEKTYQNNYSPYYLDDYPENTISSKVEKDKESKGEEKDWTGMLLDVQAELNAKDREEREEEIDDIYDPCENCEYFECKNCRFGQLFASSKELPFCHNCKIKDCENCLKLNAYLENYPEDIGKFAHHFKEQGEEELW